MRVLPPEVLKLFCRSFFFPSPVRRGMNDVFPSATLMFILSKRGNLGLSLNGHPGCGGTESGSRNIIVFWIREVIPAAASPCPTLASTGPVTSDFFFGSPFREYFGHRLYFHEIPLLCWVMETASAEQLYAELLMTG